MLNLTRIYQKWPDIRENIQQYVSVMRNAVTEHGLIVLNIYCRMLTAAIYCYIDYVSYVYAKNYLIILWLHFWGNISMRSWEIDWRGLVFFFMKAKKWRYGKLRVAFKSCVAEWTFTN